MGARGAFIVFEGIDGSGKSTHVGLLTQELRQRGHEILQTAEPSMGNIGVFIREYLERADQRHSAEVEALLFAADRFEHSESIIKPALREGKIVVSDRYTHSSLAYQGAEGVAIDWIREMNRFALKPDLCLLLDVPPEMGLGRISGRRKTVFEAYEFQRRIRDLYLRFVDEGELVKVDASGPVEEVQRQVLLLVDGCLGRLKIKP